MLNKRNEIEHVYDLIDVSFDRLNQPKREINFYKASSNFKPVYMSILTNGYTRILRFDNIPPARHSSTRNNNQIEEEKKANDAAEDQKILKFRTFIKMVQISICSPGKELVTIYLNGISALVEKIKNQTSFAFNLQSMQIDN